jgi:excisionase family DNA binding protein
MGIIIEQLMTIPDVAQVTKLSVSTIRKYVFEKTIPYFRVGGNVRFRPSDIEAWIKKCEVNKGGTS